MNNYYYFTGKKNLLKKGVKNLYQRYTERQSISSRREARILTCLYSLAYNCTRVKKEGNSFRIILDRNFYSSKCVLNGKRVKVQIDHKEMRSILDWCIEEGLISLYIGGKSMYREFDLTEGEANFTHTGRESSIITFLPNFIGLFSETEIMPKLENVLILRDDTGEAVNYQHGETQQEIIEHLNTYNEWISQFDIIDQHGLPQHPQIKRIFNMSWESGGRFYTDGGTIQCMPSEDRRNLTIDGVQVVEIDVKCMHPAIMFTEGGGTIEHDPYNYEIACDYNEIEVQEHIQKFNLTNYNPLRNFSKRFLLISVNAETDTSARRAMAQELGNDKKKIGREDEDSRKYVGISMVSLSKTLDNLKTHNMLILDKFCSGYGKHLQFIDSLFMYFVIEYCISENIPVVPVHDSVLVPIKDKEKTKYIMTNAWKEIFNNTINFKLEEKL